jgi:hypothetical protein
MLQLMLAVPGPTEVTIAVLPLSDALTVAAFLFVEYHFILFAYVLKFLIDNSNVLFLPVKVLFVADNSGSSLWDQAGRLLAASELRKEIIGSRSKKMKMNVITLKILFFNRISSCIVVTELLYFQIMSVSCPKLANN